MSDTREKLSDLLGYYLPPIDRSRCMPYVNGKCNGMCAECTAEQLIANGVTTATDNNVGGKWIPVSERLPDLYMNEDGCICTKGKVVFRVASTHTVHLGYAIKRLCVTDHDSFEIVVWYDDTGDRIEDVTHWMPLPEPPKGE